MTIDGTWTIGYQTPGGRRQTDLVLRTAGTALTGSFDGTPISDGQTDGTQLSFTAQLTSPFKVKIKCAASIDGDTITGKAKAAILTIPFAGTRTAA
jgi:hypothetical protein